MTLVRANEVDAVTAAILDISTRVAPVADECPDPSIAALIRATLVAAGVADSATDAELEALVLDQVTRRRGTDLATAVGAVVLERYSALRPPGESGADQPVGGDLAASASVPAVVAPPVGRAPDLAPASTITPTAPIERPPRTEAPTNWTQRFPEAPPESPREKPSRTSSPRRERVRRSKTVVLLTWTRNIGLVILLFVAWQLWGTGLTEHHEQSALASEFVRQTNKVPERGVAPARLRSSTPDVAPAAGALVGRLQIPAISLSQYVVEGTTAPDLSEGPGHYVGTALPGFDGNVAIAGHRTTYGAPFNRLGQIVAGDVIYLTTMSGERFTYRVEKKPVAVLPGDVAILDNFGDDRLTLTTCNPEFSASQRLVVVGIYQAPKVLPTTKSPGVALGVSGSAPRTTPVTAPAQHAPVATAASLSGAGGVGWDWGALPLPLLYAAVLVLLGLLYNRAYRRFRWACWLVLAPAWILGLVLLFSAVTKISPTTL
jgi:sortase A